MLEARSALGDLLELGGRNGVDGRRGLRLGEIRGWQLLQIGTFRRHASEADTAVRLVTGGELPGAANEVARRGVHRLYRIATDQYWIVTPDVAVEAALRSEIPAGTVSVTSLSTARTRLLIEGACARALLGHLVSIDLGERAFPVGHFAQTGVHHAGVLLERVAQARYELYVLRTFAQSTWEVLVDAALPFGYDVRLEIAPTG